MATPERIPSGAEAVAPAMASLLEEMDAFYGATEVEPVDQRLQQIREALFGEVNAGHALLAWAREPGRSDLTRGLARLEWRASNTPAMLAALADADHATGRAAERWGFAEELLRGGVPRDSIAALETLMNVTADSALTAGARLNAAERA